MNPGIYDEALRLAGSLAAVLADWDSADLTLPREALEQSIRDAWFRTVEDAKQSKVSLRPEYLSSLHGALGAAGPRSSAGAFNNGNSPNDWDTFRHEVFDSEAGISGAEAWILAQVYWGEHVPSMKFSLAWLLMNGLRLQSGYHALMAPQRDAHAFVDALFAAGPPCRDAESLRALFGSYESERSANI